MVAESCYPACTGDMYQKHCLTSRNVERPIARLSEAPMRVNTESKTCMLALAAGTKEPICMPKADCESQELLSHKTLSHTETLSAEKAGRAARRTTVSYGSRHSKRQWVNICSEL